MKIQISLRQPMLKTGNTKSEQLMRFHLIQAQYSRHCVTCGKKQHLPAFRAFHPHHESIADSFGYR